MKDNDADDYDDKVNGDVKFVYVYYIIFIINFYHFRS